MESSFKSTTSKGSLHYENKSPNRLLPLGSKVESNRHVEIRVAESQSKWLPLVVISIEVVLNASGNVPVSDYRR